MLKAWNIIYYESDNNSPVQDFIEGLELKARTKVANSLDLLKEFGTKLGLPHAKKLTGTKLWELRILGNDNIRVFYIAIVNRSFLLLHGFQKKKQKTERKEIDIAEKRLNDFRSRK